MTAPPTAQLVQRTGDGWRLPGIANLHSHAFQRAMAGLSEARGPEPRDTFWTWRQIMYRFLDHLTPQDVEAIAALVQMEMLEAGYATNVEFHYLHHQIGGKHYANIAEMSERIAAAAAARSAAIAAHRDAVGTAARLRGLLAQTDAAYADVAEAAEAAAIVTRLADTVAGRAPNTMKMDLETFVLAAELEEIVAAANIRLAEMSSGRYTLHHSDARAARGRASGLGIDVLDAHTGRLRPPQSLSGGETFLASLALALGLGEVVTARAGGIRLDTLFVDEGFGSLDPETLELAMRTLDELRAGGRTVGVISHVEAMKEQVPAQVLVEATPEGPSVIRQDAAVRR